MAVRRWTLSGAATNLDSSIVDAYLIGDLGDAGGTVHDAAVGEAEDAAMPWALHRAIRLVECSFGERATGVAAAPANGVDLIV
jgi:hypothetical protein